MKNIVEGQANNSITATNNAPSVPATAPSPNNSTNNASPTNNSKTSTSSKNTASNNNASGVAGNNDNKFIVASGYQMGPYDGLVLTLDNPVSKYVKQTNASLSDKEEMCVYQGIDMPLKCDKTLYSGMGPSITGVSGDDQNLFMFYRNKSSPECCPSTFTTSTGCVCTTEEQRNYINRRGMVSSKQ